MKPSLLFLVGPTASGKSELALELASKLGAEIISADSMLVYRGMDIGTAKPSRKDQEDVPHHFIDLVEPGQDFSVFEYRKRVLDLLSSPGSQGKTFIVVGGSGLYVKALLHGISEKPGANPELRRKLLAGSGAGGFESLRERLKTVDPAYAEIALDERRVLRALEVYEMTGRTMTEWDRETEGLLKEGYKIKIFGIRWEKEIFRKRIEERTRRMIDAGLVGEVRALETKPWARNSRQAIGYQEVLEFLHGTIPQEELGSLIVKNTLALMKRQMTWFKKEPNIDWFDLKDENDWKTISAKIIERWTHA